MAVSKSVMLKQLDEQIETKRAAGKKSNGTTLRRIRRLLKAWESRYECSSEEMADRLTNDQVRETADISEWMFEYGVYRRLAI